MMMKKIIAIGVGGVFYEIREALEDEGYSIIGYINDKKNDTVDLPYLGDDNAPVPENISKIITVGGVGEKIGLRKRLYEIHKDGLINLFFKGAIVSRSTTFKENSSIIVFPNTVIQAQAEIGENVFINPGSMIGHHVKIGNHTQISVGVLIGGRTIIGEQCFIGMGAKIFENVKIGNGSIIGADTLVAKDVAPGSVIVRSKSRQLIRG